MLAHRHRELLFPSPVNLAEPRIAIPVGMKLDVFVPQNLKRDVFALDLTMHSSPIGLRTAPAAALGARFFE
ncbi:hypothetical protein D3C83_26940 [compost metagenome]